MRPILIATLNQLVQRLRYLPFLVALLVIGYIGWVADVLVQYPDDGIYSVGSDGYVSVLFEDGPAGGKLKVGDIIRQVEGHAWTDAVYSYTDLTKEIGDVVTFEVQRDNRVFPVEVKLAAPPVSQVVDRLIPLLVALCFWLGGVIIQAYKPAGRGGLAFLWFQASAMTLAAGSASTIGMFGASTVFNSLLWLLGPLSVHFHMNFPEAVSGRRLASLLPGLYVLGAVGCFSLLVLQPYGLLPPSWLHQYVLPGGRLFLLASLLLVAGILIDGYRRVKTPGARGKIRLVLLGCGLVLVTFVALTLLPDLLLQKPLIPYSYAFLVLIFLPLTYLYAIFRLKFIEIDKHINRGATYILVYSIMGGVYLVLYALFDQFFTKAMNDSSLLNVILVLTLASIFLPLHQKIQRFVDRIFYGGWYDYRVGVNAITRGLEQTTDLRELGKTITTRLEQTLRLEEAVAFFRDPAGDFSVIQVSITPSAERPSGRAFPVLPRSSLTYLLKIGVTERESLIRQLEQVELSPEELQLLNTEQIHLWVPIIGHGQIHGLLALGPKLSGDVFSAEDMDILRVVVQQLGPQIENIHLVTRLKDDADVLAERVEARTAELHDAKERVEAILASVGDGVIVTGLEGEIQRVNSAFEGLSGKAAADLVGADVFDLFLEENEPHQITAIRSALARDHHWSGELAGRRPDGTRYDMQINLAPVHDRNDLVVSYVGTLTDITRKKELDRLKDMFISDVSHELRTPITNIRLYLELLNTAGPDRQKRFLGVIKEQSEELTRLVEDILDLSRLNISKKRQVSFGEVNLNLIAEQVVTAHLPLADANGIKLLFEPDSESPVILAEQNQVARMITNLVSNAIRYTPAGQVCVRLRAGDGCACVTIEDTGIGIEPQDVPHLFERFYRGKNVRQTDTHGTGLGLAIVKEIVDLHDGWIEVDSTPGQGSKFTVWMPALRV